MLRLEGVETFYQASQALFGVDLEMREGEVITLLGRNGMGKSTTVRSIMGIVPAARGRIIFDGDEIQTLPSYLIARRGLGLVPEGRQVFPNLTLRENLLVTAANNWSVFFPSFPGCGSERKTTAISCPVASNRCWRSPVH